MKINYRNLNDIPCTLGEFEEDTRIVEIMELIYAKEGIKPCLQILKFEDRELTAESSIHE